MVFYWVWWIVVILFVGFFFVRVFCGCMVCEFVLGVMFVLVMMCFIWFVFVGGMVINFEFLGEVDGVILGVGILD